MSVRSTTGLVLLTLACAPAAVPPAADSAGRQVPIPFALEVDGAAFVPRHRYQARATIRADGRLLFTSTTAIVVDPDAWPDRL